MEVMELPDKFTSTALGSPSETVYKKVKRLKLL